MNKHTREIRNDTLAPRRSSFKSRPIPRQTVSSLRLKSVSHPSSLSPIEAYYHLMKATEGQKFFGLGQNPLKEGARTFQVNKPINHY
jgi:hypothetical protein